MKALDNGSEASPVYPIAYYEPVGAHTQVALGAAAVTLARPAGATQILVQSNTQNARFRLDGVDPDAATGFLLIAGAAPIALSVTGADLRVFRAAAGAVLEYQWLA